MKSMVRSRSTLIRVTWEAPGSSPGFMVGPPSTCDRFTPSRPRPSQAPGPERHATQSARPARHDPDRRKGVDRLAALVERGPFDLDDPLRLRLRRRELDHLALDVEHVAGADWREPTQLVDPDPQQRMRAERAHVGRQSHGNGRGMPTRRGEALQRRLLGGGLVEVVGLRIELRREPLDVLSRHELFRALEAHAEREIVEPFDHGPPVDRAAWPALETRAILGLYGEIDHVHRTISR